MPKPRSEEQFPLLLFLVGDEEVSQNNRRIFGRGRFDGIASGASAIITEWPNYLSSCWVTALICAVTLFVLSLLLTSCMSFEYNRRLPRCATKYPLDNKTIHLVHSMQKWSPNQLELLENITHTFPNYSIHLIIIKNQFLQPDDLAKNVTGTNNTSNILLKTLTHKVKTLHNLLKVHPNIHVNYNTYNNIFETTPLFINWMTMSEQTKIFAVRILQMWQYGGLSFDLMEYNPRPPKKNGNGTNYFLKKLQKLIQKASIRYEKLHPDEVSIDQYGIHMECKTPCHAFFGKVLTKLKKAHEKSTPRSVLDGPLYTFCLDGVIEKSFCHSKNFILF